ncbi:MAG: hypothetical protein Q8R55_04685 [Candidatus Taylorbacteria bacterium]|nr:hypothetical protein [Candidatus Taylorbacteria bacterium]
MRTITSFVIGVFVVLAMAVSAEAQWGRGYDPRVNMIIGAVTGTDGYRGGYRQPYPTRGGYYDPYMIEAEMQLKRLKDFLKVPGVLVACRLAMSTMRPGQQVATDCRVLIRSSSPQELQEQLNEFPESNMLGTQHPEGGVMEFRAYDPTHRPLNRNHKDCLPIEVVREASVVQQSGGAPVSYQEQAVSQPVASPVDPLANITWDTVNTTDFRAVVMDPNTGEKKLIPAGGSMSLHDPSGEQPYTVVLLEPGRGKSNQIPGEIRPSQDLQGWEIVAR